MGKNTQMLENARCVMLLLERTGDPVRKKHGLTGIEMDVLAFLINHPELDTARDLVDKRMLPKANVSQGVDALMKRGLIQGTRDANDRRLMHLSLTKDGWALAPEIIAAREQFERVLFMDFSEEERAVYQQLNARISRCARAYLEGKVE